MRARAPALTVAVVLAAGGLGGCTIAARGDGPAPAGERTVVLDVRWSRFSPSDLTVPPGTTVRFEVRNADPIAHELIVGDDSVQDRHERGTETRHGDRPGDPPGEVSVLAQSTAVTSYTFSRPGRVPFGCHLPGHWSYGMRGVVVVG